MRRNDLRRRAARRRNHPSTSGFTLIEILVVIVLIMMIALLSTPYILGQISRARVEGAANQSVSLIQRTRLTAIRLNQEQTISANDGEITGAGIVSLQELNIDLWNEDLCHDPDNDGTDDYSDADIVFDSQGKASGKSAFCVTDGRGNIFQVAIDSLQGTPRIRKFLQPGDSPTGSAGFFLDNWAWY